MKKSTIKELQNHITSTYTLMHNCEDKPELYAQHKGFIEGIKFALELEGELEEKQ